jgi:hypothetical protein
LGVIISLDIFFAMLVFKIGMGRKGANLRLMADMDTVARSVVLGTALPPKWGSLAQARLAEARLDERWRPSARATSIAKMQAWAVSRS